MLVRSSGIPSLCLPRPQPAQLALDVGDDAHPRLVAPPGAVVAVDQLVRRARPPGAALVVREARPVALPGADDRVDELPLLLDLVLAREQRRVAEHRVEDQPLVRLGQPGAEGAAVEEVHVHGADRHPGPGHLGADRERDALVRLHVDQQHVRPQAVAGDLLERRVRRALELDRDRRLAPRQALAGADVERRVGPAPVVDVELRGDVRLGQRARRDALLLAVAGHLDALDEAARRTARARPTSGPGVCIDFSTFTFSLRTESAVKSIGGSIAVSASELQQVVLEDVADRARRLVEAGAPLDAHRLGHGDLHVVDELAVPDRLEDAVREAQRQHVLDRLLAEVVVDPEDLVLAEPAVEQVVQLARGGEVVAERLLDDQPHPALLRARARRSRSRPP